MWIRSFLTEHMGDENPIIHLYTAFAILLEHLGRMLFSFLIHRQINTLLELEVELLIYYVLLCSYQVFLGRILYFLCSRFEPSLSYLTNLNRVHGYLLSHQKKKKNIKQIYDACDHFIRVKETCCKKILVEFVIILCVGVLH